MASKGQLKLRQVKEGLLERLTDVVRDAAGEVLAKALEDSPTTVSPPSTARRFLGVRNQCGVSSSKGWSHACGPTYRCVGSTVLLSYTDPGSLQVTPRT